jgi:hypothetical protein
MRINPISIFTVFLLFYCINTVIAQSPNDSVKYSVQLRSGTILPPADFSNDLVKNFNKNNISLANKAQYVIQFKEALTPAQLKLLHQNGITVVNYLSGNAYTVVVASQFNAALLQQINTRTIFTLTPQQKMQPELVAGKLPSWAIKNPGTIDLLLTYPSSFVLNEIKEYLAQKNMTVISTQFSTYNTIHIRIATHRMEELASQPFVLYLQAIGAEEKSLNYNSRVNSRAGALNGMGGIGRNLLGNNITIGVGDEGDIQHVDFEGRKIIRNNGQEVFHSNHVSAIAAGAGIKSENLIGHAPKATIVNQIFSGILNNAASYVTDHQMVISNNSWGVIAECSYNGNYDFYSAMMDQQAFALPNLITVFAAGNSAGNSVPTVCSPYLPKFKTVLGAHQSSKNVLTVGNTSSNDVIWPSSSRGPTIDGRLKPEVVAQGAAVVSSTTGNGYITAWGTSQAAPAASGVLALLYERYKQLNGSNPPNALMKAILANTADDKGNPGPDFVYGFGRINGLRAVEAIENNRYLSSNITNGGNNQHALTVPANTAAVKVMLYWNDPAAALMASKALVNNLDLTVSTTSPAATYLPLVLNGVHPDSVNNNAIARVDTLNNIEQVTILNPTAGSYTINVSGTAVPVNAPQTYFITYDIVPISTVLTAPTGGEKLVPGEGMLINWDSYGGTPETFTLEYSINNGASWNTIATNISNTARQYVWTVPSTATKDAIVRITKDNTSQVSTSATFTILGAPTVTLAPITEQCEGYIKLNWTTVADATAYEITQLIGNEMVGIATLPNTASTYTISGLSKYTNYWVSVRAMYNGNAGRRAIAIARMPMDGDCTGLISDNDIKIDTILSPLSSGRVLTNTALSATTPLTVRVKNVDDAISTSALTFSYALSYNGGAPVVVTDASVSPVIAANGTYDYTFTSPVNMSAVGNYDFVISVTNVASDPVLSNNSLSIRFKQLPNATITLPFIDNLETATVQSTQQKQVGLSGLDRYDFSNSTAAGRLQTFINSGIAYSGNRAITLDAALYTPAGNTDSLTGTFNMTGMDINTQDIRLDFRYKNHGQQPAAGNKVWIRGSDSGAWIEAYDLAANQNEADGSFKLSASIELTDLLKNASPAQPFTSSFQIRWGQHGNFSAADNNGFSGYSFDDIRLYAVTDDIQLVVIDTPVINSCNLSSTTPIRIIIRNNAENVVSNVPVSYRINGGTWVTETVTGSLAANTSYYYTFSTPANLSANTTFLIEARANYASDNYQVNDTASKTIINANTITVTNSIPYLEGFENNNGGWYSNGTNNSWDYGTPNSYKINRAANGSKAWKTRNGGNYSDSEKSYLYSPCFDISTVTSPTLSMNIALDLEDCGATVFCDGAYVEFSTTGFNWSRLGANGQGTNWYNKSYASNNLWSIQNYTRWHVATIPLSVLPLPTNQYTRIQFRIAVASDALVTREGIAIDDVHIYSNPFGIYDIAGTSPETTQPVVNGTNWIHFIETGTSKIIASLNPQGLNLGSTSVQSYIHSGTIRTNSGQYYHNRNITIKPTNNVFPLPTDSATVRFYFLDSETEALIAATGCATCNKPAMAHELGISKYSEPGFANEDGIVENGTAGMWQFILGAKVKKVPYDRGYYAEFKVKDFSEFWLNNGGINGNQPLPLRLLDFTAKKINEQDVAVNWLTAAEVNISRFEVDVAKSAAAYLSNEYVRITSINSSGNANSEQRYSFIDIESNKSGTRYYRLKIIETDGKFYYSPIKPVLFINDHLWTLQPNPSSGIFYLGIQATLGQAIHINVSDMTGRVVHQQKTLATGFVQKMIIDLENPKYASGIYLLEATTDTGKKNQFKLIKQ